MSNIRWGFAGPWYGQLMTLDKDAFQARLKFLQKYDLKVVGVGLRHIEQMEVAQRESLAQFLSDNDMEIVPHVGFDYLKASADEIAREAQALATALSTHLPWMKSTIAVTTPRAGHRFDRTMPLSEKMERLSKALAPLAGVCHEAGISLGIENHGDYYCSDLAQLCHNTPHLYIFLDTGNTYLVGERPLQAFEVAAPFTVGTHFKDHRVAPCPEARPLHFEVAGSVLGEGDVPLRECYQLLLEKAPFPDNLIMEMEVVSPDDVDPLHCFERSLAFVRSL
ncbi:MAG TPA: TIM barrel protein [Abditibacteriaceae bacterium]